MLMSHSNRGLNEPFYKWIDDIRRAMRKEKELQDKLDFYNMKLIGYKGVSYDRIGSSGSRLSGDGELLYWLDKIIQTEKEIEHTYRVLRDYKTFVDMIDPIERLVLDETIINRVDSEKLKVRDTKYIINRIIQKWFRTKTMLFLN